MKITMKQIAIIWISVLLTLSGSLLHAQDEAFDAVYLSVIRQYTLNRDGTADYNYFKQQKLQNHRSFHRLFGETFIIYNPDYQKLTIDQSFTVMANGLRVITPGNAFNEVLPRFSTHATAFNRMREMVVTHTGLEVGSTIFLGYNINTAAGYLPAFMGSAGMAEDQPVKSSTVILRVPEDQPLYFKLFNSGVTPSEKIENGFRVYTWILNEIPAISNEDHRPENAAFYPVLTFSSQGGYLPLAGFFLNQEAFRYFISESMSRFVSELIPGMKEKKEILFAIQDAVVKDINLSEIPEQYTGFRIRTPEEVWSVNGGTVAEKAVLLTALLRHAGIPAVPVLVLNGSLYDEMIGTLSILEDWIVKADVEGMGETFLSVKQSNAFDMTVPAAGKVFLALSDTGFSGAFIPKPGLMNVSMKGMLVLDTGMTLTGDLEGILKNSANPALALARSENKMKSYLRGGLASPLINDLKLTRSGPGETMFSCRVTKSDALKTDGDLYYFTLPGIGTGIESLDFHILFSGRLTPLLIPSPLSEVYDLTLAVPEELSLVSGEKDIRIRNSAGHFLFQVRRKDNILSIHKEISVEKNRIEPSEYTAFKELVDSWNIQQNNMLIFLK